MSKTKDLILAMLFGALLFGLGMWVSQSDTVVQAQGGEPDRYQLAHGSYSSTDTQRFYAIKLDRQTGETQVLSVKGHASDDKWMLLPLEDKR